MMGVTLHNKEEVLAAVIGGLSRVANAILATPAESRIDAIDAVAESYRKAARAFLDEEETEKWLEEVRLRLRAEVAARASEQQTNEPQDEAPTGDNQRTINVRLVKAPQVIEEDSYLDADNGTHGHG
jgi:hypothetical protein